MIKVYNQQNTIVIHENKIISAAGSVVATIIFCAMAFVFITIVFSFFEIK